MSLGMHLRLRFTNDNPSNPYHLLEKRDDLLLTHSGMHLQMKSWRPNKETSPHETWANMYLGWTYGQWGSGDYADNRIEFMGNMAELATISCRSLRCVRIDDEIQNFHCHHIRRYRNRVSHTSHELYAEKPNYTDAFSSKYPFIAYNYTIFANQDGLNSVRLQHTPDVHIDNNTNFDINNSYSNTITDFIRRGSKVVDLQPAPNKWWL